MNEILAARPLRHAAAESIGAMVAKAGDGLADRLLAGLSGTWGFLHASPDVRAVGVVLTEAITSAVESKEGLVICLIVDFGCLHLYF